MGRSILICDGESGIRTSLKTMLEDMGFEEILECGDGERAVDTALSSYPDIVILDSTLPRMDGITAAGEIRKKLRIPVILLTDGCDPKTVKQAAESGIAAFLAKPLRRQDLLPALEMAMAHTYEVEELKERIADLKESIENRKVVEKAKGVLMERNGCPESGAYRIMQKLAMDNRKTLRQIADAVLRGAC